MQFKFDANQEYQLSAIESVVNLFEGQPQAKLELKLSLAASFAAAPNRLDLDEDALLKNLQAVQTANNLPADAGLLCIEGDAKTAEGQQSVRFPNFSVEMETGTGKTYIYIRT